MTIEIKVPVLPESVADAMIATWHKQPGESIRRDENLVDLETDKVVLEVPAPKDGVLKEIMAEVGDVVTAEQLIAIIEEGSVETAATQGDSAASDAKTNGEAILSPAAQVIAEEKNIDTSTISGTGKDGRITKEDVVNAANKSSSASAATTAPAAASASATASATDEPKPLAGSREVRRVPMSRLRQTIANRLVQSQQTAAILTTFNEVDLKAVMKIRASYKDDFEKKTGSRLGFMSFFVKATCEALQKFPAVNAYLEGDDIVYHDYADIGIAVSSPRGLVVPVVRNAEAMNFAEIETTIRDFGLRARDGKIAMDELIGGTFTITNGGVFGSMLSTPIINPPQSGILGMHNIVERPMVVNGKVVVRPMMYLAMSYDHRIIDGKEAVSFLVSIKESLEDPSRMLLGL